MDSKGRGKEKTGETAKLLRRIAELEARVAELEARQKLNRKVERQMTAENAVTRILAESASPGQVIPRILQTLCECLEWELGDFWCLDRSANLLYYKDLWHGPTLRAEKFALASKQFTFSPGVGLPGRVLVSGKPNWILDVVKDRNFPRAQFAEEAGLHSACGFPILLGNEILGVMDFFCSTIQEPDEELIQIMADIGSRIGDFNWNNWQEDWVTKRKEDHKYAKVLKLGRE